VAETPYFKFRLPADVLADLNALAASNGGNNTTAVKESVQYWRVAVEHAAGENARALKPAEWAALAHLNDPDPWPEGVGPADGPVCWSARLAHELEGQWEGRACVLPEHRKERAACRKLAEKIRLWDLARGYALFAALRHFWRHPDSGVGGGEWWHPEVFMTPTGADPCRR
jgi:hypothetical protein